MVDGAGCRRRFERDGSGSPGSGAAQVAGILAPVLVSLVYVFVRGQEKRALADVLRLVLPGGELGLPSVSSGGDEAPPEVAEETPVLAEPEALAVGGWTASSNLRYGANGGGGGTGHRTHAETMPGPQ